MESTNKTVSMIMLVSAFSFWMAVSLPKLHGQSINEDSIEFINSSGENALVKLVGPSRSMVDVPNGQSRAVGAIAGSYYILVRYGERGKYRYSRGDRFNFQQEPGYYSRISITLHKVINGNYGSRGTTQSEFDSIN